MEVGKLSSLTKQVREK